MFVEISDGFVYNGYDEEENIYGVLIENKEKGI